MHVVADAVSSLWQCRVVSRKIVSSVSAVISIHMSLNHICIIIGMNEPAASSDGWCAAGDKPMSIEARNGCTEMVMLQDNITRVGDVPC